MYADVITKSIQKTIDETNYRREKQTAYNLANGMVPTALNKSLDSVLAKNSVSTHANELEDRRIAEEANRYLTKPQIEKKIRTVRKAMEQAAKSLEFIEAAKYRDEIKLLKEQL